MAHTPRTQDTPLASGLAEKVAMGGRPRTWLCGVAVAAVEVAVRGRCVLGKATVRPSGFWPYCTGWNNLDAWDRKTRQLQCRLGSIRAPRSHTQRSTENGCPCAGSTVSERLASLRPMVSSSPGLRLSPARDQPLLSHWVCSSSDILPTPASGACNTTVLPAVPSFVRRSPSCRQRTPPCSALCPHSPIPGHAATPPAHWPQLFPRTPPTP